MPETLTAEHIILIGLAASLLTYVVKQSEKLTGKKLSREVLTAVLFALSVALALVFAFPTLPAFPAGGADPAQNGAAVVAFIQSLLAVAGSVIGFATLIYNLLLKRVLESLGW